MSRAKIINLRNNCNAHPKQNLRLPSLLLFCYCLYDGVKPLRIKCFCLSQQNRVVCTTFCVCCSKWFVGSWNEQIYANALNVCCEHYKSVGAQNMMGEKRRKHRWTGRKLTSKPKYICLLFLCLCCIIVIRWREVLVGIYDAHKAKQQQEEDDDDE